MLTGVFPPELAVSASSRPPLCTLKEEMVLLPAFTANNQSPSPPKAKAPWEARGAPVPMPPEATTPAGVKVPSTARWNTRTWLPALALDSVYTVPVPLAERARPPLTRRDPLIRKIDNRVQLIFITFSRAEGHGGVRGPLGWLCPAGGR
jgi:hypothetical protein